MSLLLSLRMIGSRRFHGSPLVLCPQSSLTIIIIKKCTEKTLSGIFGGFLSSKRTLHHHDEKWTIALEYCCQSWPLLIRRDYLELLSKSCFRQSVTLGADYVSKTLNVEFD